LTTPERRNLTLLLEFLTGDDQIDDWVFVRGLLNTERPLRDFEIARISQIRACLAHALTNTRQANPPLA
jgi:hypothetical protein